MRHLHDWEIRELERPPSGCVRCGYPRDTYGHHVGPTFGHPFAAPSEWLIKMRMHMRRFGRSARKAGTAVGRLARAFAKMRS